MQTLKVGDVTITSIIERDGPWRKPEDMFLLTIRRLAAGTSLRSRHHQRYCN